VERARWFSLVSTERHPIFELTVGAAGSGAVIVGSIPKLVAEGQPRNYLAVGEHPLTDREARLLLEETDTHRRADLLRRILAGTPGT
jgi:hypothetical protein